MSKCPHCEQDLIIPERSRRNVTFYHVSVIVVTECCNNPINLRPVMTFEYSRYTGNKVEDDWGVPIVGPTHPLAKTKS